MRELVGECKECRKKFIVTKDFSTALCWRIKRYYASIAPVKRKIIRLAYSLPQIYKARTNSSYNWLPETAQIFKVRIYDFVG